MDKDELNFDRSEEDIIAEARANGDDHYIKPLSWLKIGDLMKINDRPCKVTELASRNKKHGMAMYIAGVDLFTGDKRETCIYHSCRICYTPSCEDGIVTIPLVGSREYLVINLTFKGALTLLDEETNEDKDDVELPAGALGEQIREAANTDDVIVTVLRGCGEEGIIKFRRKEE
ncbi:hypothetical protein PENTCL1PPCAC_21963, partial [Pristionchus entomophagus]